MKLTFFIHLVICSSHSFGFTLCNIALVTALATISFMKLHVGLKPMRLTSKNTNVNILKNLLSKINEFLQLNSGCDSKPPIAPKRYISFFKGYPSSKSQHGCCLKYYWSIGNTNCRLASSIDYVLRIAALADLLEKKKTKTR